MKKRVLVVHPSSDMILAIQDLLDEIAKAEGVDLAVVRAKSQSRAEQAAGGDDVDLLVASLEIPESDQASAAAGEQQRRGLALARKLRAGSNRPAAILITGHVDDAVFAASQSEGIGLVLDGSGFAAGLEKQVRAHLLAAQASSKDADAEPPERVDLEISLKEQGCYYQFQREGKPAGEVHLLSVNAKKLATWVADAQDWVKTCRRFVEEPHHGPDDPEWKRKLKRLSEALTEELFERTPENIGFLRELSKWVGHVGIASIRVRFAVDPDIYPLPVEAFKQSVEDDYWMLKTVIYRRQEERAESVGFEPRGLFQDEQTRDGPINVLIVQADLPREVAVKTPDLDLTLGALPALAKEVARVKKQLSDLREETGHRIGEVRVIDRSAVPPGGSLRDVVEGVLKEGPWHVLHYAGHTHFDERNQVGYLFFPIGDYDLDCVRIDRFAWALRKADTRFVFLSSCRGGQQDFIYHLSKVGIPAIMGFLLDVRDEEAAAFAKSFYDQLFHGKERSLEYACLEARREMYATFPDSPIWASPVLVMRLGA
jgi:CheY-like chemotaxis protein